MPPTPSGATDDDFLTFSGCDAFASYLRASDRDVHGVSLFVSLSLLVVLVKKNELGDVLFVLHISTRVRNEDKHTTTTTKKPLLFWGPSFFF